MSNKIKLVRIDSRLLHATVSLNWNRFINANTILVVNSSRIDDPFIINVMKLCLPKTILVKFLEVEELIKYLNDNNNSNDNIMIIFSDLEIAYKAIEQGFNVKEIQLPYPAHWLAIKNLSTFFSEKELSLINEIKNRNIKLYFQTSPFDKKNYFSDM